jgi:hypothetical protein
MGWDGVRGEPCTPYLHPPGVGVLRIWGHPGWADTPLRRRPTARQPCPAPARRPCPLPFAPLTPQHAPPRPHLQINFMLLLGCIAMVVGFQNTTSMGHAVRGLLFPTPCKAKGPTRGQAWGWGGGGRPQRRCAQPREPCGSAWTGAPPAPAFPAPKPPYSVPVRPRPSSRAVWGCGDHGHVHYYLPRGLSHAGLLRRKPCAGGAVPGRVW